LNSPQVWTLVLRTEVDPENPEFFRAVMVKTDGTEVKLANARSHERARAFAMQMLAMQILEDYPLVFPASKFKEGA
jgi:hypothetical protein